MSRMDHKSSVQSVDYSDQIDEDIRQVLRNIRSRSHRQRSNASIARSQSSQDHCESIIMSRSSSSLQLRERLAKMETKSQKRVRKQKRVESFSMLKQALDTLKCQLRPQDGTYDSTEKEYNDLRWGKSKSNPQDGRTSDDSLLAYMYGGCCNDHKNKTTYKEEPVMHFDCQQFFQDLEARDRDLFGKSSHGNSPYHPADLDLDDNRSIEEDASTDNSTLNFFLRKAQEMGGEGAHTSYESYIESLDQMIMGTIQKLQEEDDDNDDDHHEEKKDEEGEYEDSRLAGILRYLGGLDRADDETNFDTYHSSSYGSYYSHGSSRYSDDLSRTDDEEDTDDDSRRYLVRSYHSQRQEYAQTSSVKKQPPTPPRSHHHHHHYHQSPPLLNESMELQAQDYFTDSSSATPPAVEPVVVASKKTRRRGLRRMLV